MFLLYVKNLKWIQNTINKTRSLDGTSLLAAVSILLTFFRYVTFACNLTYFSFLLKIDTAILWESMWLHFCGGEGEDKTLWLTDLIGNWRLENTGNTHQSTVNVYIFDLPFFFLSVLWTCMTAVWELLNADSWRMNVLVTTLSPHTPSVDADFRSMYKSHLYKVHTVVLKQ